MDNGYVIRTKNHKTSKVVGFLAQYTNKTVMRIGGLILNSTKFFPLFESADVLALPNSSH